MVWVTRRHELSDKQWESLKPLLPVDEGRSGRRPHPNRIMINAMLWVLRTGAPWRDLPKEYPRWKAVHTRFLRWSKRGIWKRILEELAIDLDDEFAILDASIVRVHQDAVGGKKNGSECVGHSRGGATTKIHAVVDSLGNPTKIELTEGQVHDVTMAPELLRFLSSTMILADKGYDSNAVIAQIESQGCQSVIPARRCRLETRNYDRHVFKSRYLVEHFFQKIKRHRRICTRYEKLAVTFLGMIILACILLWII